MTGLDPQRAHGYLFVKNCVAIAMSADFCKISKALADPQRRELLEKIAQAGEMSCSALVGCCPVSQATVSHHLKELVNAGLIEPRKEGQFRFYRFVPARIAAYTEELAKRMGLPLGA